MATTQPGLHTREMPSSVARPARGGVSGGAVLTGVVVAFGAMSLLSALVAGVVTLGLPEETPFPGTAVQGTIFAGVVLAITQFVAYLWGGYTAGRMARGSGWANGLLVPLVAILLMVVIGAIVATLANASLSFASMPFQSSRLPLSQDVVVEWGAGIGIASVLAMFIGGGVGGTLGARWHARLEREAAEVPAAPSAEPVTDPSPGRPTDTP